MLKGAIKRSTLSGSADDILSNSSNFGWLGGATTKQGTPVSSASAKTLSAFYNGIPFCVMITQNYLNTS